MKSNKSKGTAIPMRPQERPKYRVHVQFAVLPSKSSQENVDVEEQKLPPSLILEDIHKVCVETAKPASEIN